MIKLDCFTIGSRSITKTGFAINNPACGESAINGKEPVQHGNIDRIKGFISKINRQNKIGGFNTNTIGDFNKNTISVFNISIVPVFIDDSQPPMPIARGRIIQRCANIRARQQPSIISVRALNLVITASAGDIGIGKTRIGEVVATAPNRAQR